MELAAAGTLTQPGRLISAALNYPVAFTACFQFSELISTYTKIADDWVAETPSDAHDVLALVNFVIAAMGRQGCDAEGKSIIGRARDRFDALVALESIREWVNEIDLREFRNEIAAGRGSGAADAVIRARLGADA
jgi:hypothetical protein